MFEKKRATLPYRAVFESQRNRIKVIMLIDSTRQAGNMIDVARPEKKKKVIMFWSGGANFDQQFWGNIRYHRDTMSINLGLVKWNSTDHHQPQVFFTMKRIEKVYYNGRLQKEF